MNISHENIARSIDHTLLKPDSTGIDIMRLCSEAVSFGFGAVCVNPARVALATEALSGSGVRVCSVAGFPLGASTTAVKAAEAAAVRDGAGEVDMVINIGMLKEGKLKLVYEDVRAVVKSATAAGPLTLVKVIIETCYLTDEEKEAACRICERAGAHFIKTSTGTGPTGATVEDVGLIRSSLSASMGIKASGGIKTLDQALKMLGAGATRIGTSSGVQIMKELLNKR